MAWNTTKLMAIGALSALTIILSFPGALLAGLTGIYSLSAAGNAIVIGIMYPLIALIFKKPGAITLWSLTVGIIAIPLPIAGPPGLFIKVLYMAFWGILGDITYVIFQKSEKILAIAEGVVQLGPGAPLAVLVWTLLNAPNIASQYAKFSGFSILIGSIGGGVLGYISYLIYKKLEKTNVVKRICGEKNG
jgi:hypothetical protein